MTKEEQFEIMRVALGTIAFERKSEIGGYISRRDLVTIARRALTSCMLDWPQRHAN